MTENLSLADLLRKTLKLHKVPARVQTYRNHSDLSVYPTNKTGWTDSEWESVREIVNSLSLSTVSQRATGVRFTSWAQGHGLRYLRDNRGPGPG